MKKLQGRILEASTGKPLPGSVHVFTTDGNGAMLNGTSTNASGEFTLEIPENAVNITFSHIGYGITTYAISDIKDKVDHSLTEQSGTLDEATVLPPGWLNRNWKYVALAVGVALILKS